MKDILASTAVIFAGIVFIWFLIQLVGPWVFLLFII